MTQNIQWPPIGGQTYPIPEDGETNWPTLTAFLVALAQAQGTKAQKSAVRVLTTTPASISAANDHTVSVELGVPAVATVNLPAGNPGQTFVVVDGLGDAGTHNITVVPFGSETIQGQATYLMNANGAAVGLQFFAGDWKVVAQAAGEGAGGGIARSSIDSATPNWVVINDASGKLSQEARLDPLRGGLGVNASAASGYVKFTTGTASFSASIPTADLASGIPATKIGGGGVDNTEFAYLDGVTSSIQTQFTDVATALGSKADATATATALAAKVTGPASSVDSEVMLFSGTTGKVAKRMTGTGVLHVTAGVASVATVLVSEGGSGQTTANAALNAFLPAQTGNASKVLTTDGTNTSWAASVGGYQTSVVTANPSPAQNNIHYLANTQSGAFTITLPNGATGARIKISDDRGYWDVNNLTITPASGERIWPLAANVSLTCNVIRGWIELVWDGSGWSPNSLASTTLGSGAGLVAQEVNSSLTAVSGVMYEYDLTSGPYVLTLPVGTGAAVVGFQDRKSQANSTKYLKLNPDLTGSIDTYSNGDTVDMDYANFSGVLYRASGSTIWYRQKQLTSTIVPGFQTGYTGAAAIAAGNIGEVITGSVSIVSLAVTDTWYQTGFIDLTPGQWLIRARVGFGGAGTTETEVRTCISTTSAIQDIEGFANDLSVGTTKSRFVKTDRLARPSISTRYYLNVFATFTGSAPGTQTSLMFFEAVRIA